MKWKKSDIESLKNRCDIVEVAQRLGVEVKHGRARCIHPQNHKNGDRTPSMTVSSDKNSFNCWVCPDVHGDVIALVQQVESVGFIKALEWLSEFAGQRPSSPGFPSSPNSQGNQGASQKVVKFSSEQPSQLVDPTIEIKFTVPPKGSAPWVKRRSELVLSFLRLCSPLEGPVMRYLNKRKIFKKTIETQKLRYVKDYRKVSDEMKAAFSMEELKEYGFFNDNHHLRFFKHELILPYLDEQGYPVYFQARSIDPETSPKELNLKGPITLPYNRPLLNLMPGVIYLCEGVIDTLTLLDKGFQAVGVPGVKAFREEWIDLFKNKKVYIAFDNDAPGQEATAKVKEMLKSHDIFANNIQLPEGMDINSWFRPS